MLASLQHRLERAEICHKCDKYIKHQKRCSVCGCIMSLKIAIASMQCPENKWLAVKPTSMSNMFKS